MTLIHFVLTEAWRDIAYMVWLVSAWGREAL